MTAKIPLRFLLTEDHAVVRRGLKQILSEAFGGAKFGEASNVRELLDLVRRQEWDVVILDVTLPGRSGLDAVQEIKTARPAAQVLMLSMHPEDQFAVRALRAGASGYLTKDSATDELVVAIEKVLSGGRYVSRALAEHLAARLSEPAGKSPHDLLSPRELEVMLLIARGESIKQIADHLSLSVKTVSTHRENLMRKLKLHNSTEIVRYALRHSLIE